MTNKNGQDTKNTLDERVIMKLQRTLLLSPNPKRDRAILQLFLHFGCTVKDIVDLRFEDVDLSNGKVYWNKTASDRISSTLPQAVLPDLVDYVKRERRAQCERFFVTRLGHPMRKAQVQRVFSFLQRESGVLVSPYTLRLRHYELIKQSKTIPTLVALRRYIPYIVYTPQKVAGQQI